MRKLLVLLITFSVQAFGHVEDSDPIQHLPDNTRITFNFSGNHFINIKPNTSYTQYNCPSVDGKTFSVTLFHNQAGYDRIFNGDLTVDVGSFKTIFFSDKRFVTSPDQACSQSSLCFVHLDIGPVRLDSYNWESFVMAVGYQKNNVQFNRADLTHIAFPPKEDGFRIGTVGALEQLLKSCHGRLIIPTPTSLN